MQKIFTSLVLLLALALSASAQPVARWYSYNDFLDAEYRHMGDSSAYKPIIMWSTDSFYFRGDGPLSPLSHVGEWVVSAGSVFMPWAPVFNDPTTYSGALAISETSAYIVDTLRIYGRHNINPAKTWVVDTLLVSTLHSALPFGYFTNATTLAAYGTDSAMFPLVHFDTVLNTAVCTSPPANTFKVPITAAMWGDTMSNGVFVVTLPVNITASPGEEVAMSVSFISGDPTYPHSGDTIERFDGTYEYNSFYPIVLYHVDTFGDMKLPYYRKHDFNSGLFQTKPYYELGWGDIYMTTLSMNQGVPNYWQHLSMDWHLTSTTGTIVGVANADVPEISVTAQPNPASNSLQIAIQNATNIQGAVTLYNMLGQSVAVQPLVNNTATFSTATLPSGLYTWSVTTGKKPVTGKVTIVH